MLLVLVDGVGGDDAPDAGGGVDAAVPAQDGTRVKDRVAADIHKVPQNGAYFSPSGGDVGLSLHHHRGLVRLDVGGDRPGAHVALVAQDGVSHIVVVGRLDAVKEDDVLQLHRVAHHAVGPHKRGAPDKGAVAHLGLRSDDAGRAQVGGGGHHSGFVDPDVLLGLAVLLRGEAAAQGENQLLDAVQGLPGVLELAEVLPRHGVGQIEQLRNRDVHQYGASHLSVFCFAAWTQARSLFRRLRAAPPLCAVFLYHSTKRPKKPLIFGIPAPKALQVIAARPAPACPLLSPPLLSHLEALQFPLYPTNYGAIIPI